MLARTHASVSLFVSILVLNHYKLGIPFILTAFICSILPDLDTPKSKVGRRIRPISTIIKFLIGHRTFIHAVWLWAIASLLVFPWSTEVAIGIGIGYGTHLLLDALTKSGVQPLFPFPPKIMFLLKTGGITETLIFIVTMTGSIVLIVSYFLI
jgi:inner membrane protein